MQFFIEPQRVATPLRKGAKEQRSKGRKGLDAQIIPVGLKSDYYKIDLLCRIRSTQNDIH